VHYAVPQFIEIEDKIIGPLTMKQFLWLLVGGGVIFMLYFLLQFGVWIMVSLLIGGGFAGMAFIRIYGMPLIQFMTSFLRFSLMSQIFIWRRKTEGPLREIPERTVFEDAILSPMPQKPRPVQGRIRALSWQLDVRGSADDSIQRSVR